MPGVASRGKGRRAVNEINMVPFIDVMLVLLIIFMVSAPLITTGVVDLPSVGKAAQRAPSVVEVIVGSDARLKLRKDGGDAQPVTLDRLAERVQALQGGDAKVPVLISADKSVRYEQVVQAMDRLQRAGVARIGLAVKQGG